MEPATGMLGPNVDVRRDVRARGADLCMSQVIPEVRNL